MAEEKDDNLLMPRSRRLAILQVTPEALMALCRPGKRVFEIIGNAIPVDATIYNIGKSDGWEFNSGNGCIQLLLHSETFPETPHGQLLPVLECPVLKTIQRTPFNGGFICLECGAGMMDRRTMEGLGEVLCENPECCTSIPARAWKDFPTPEAQS